MQVSDKEKAEDGRQDTLTVVIGKKMYYSISEVCAVTGVEAHVLRYWEKEFSLLRPKKNSGGKRAYKEKDIEVIVKIRRMLEEENCTLQTAKTKLLDERRESRTGTAGGAVAKKPDKADAAGVVGEALGPTEPFSEDRKTLSVSIPTGTATKRTKRNIVRDNNGIDRALLLSIRDGLSEVLELLEE